MRRDEYNQGVNLKLLAFVVGIFLVGIVIIGGMFVFTLGSDENNNFSTDKFMNNLTPSFNFGGNDNKLVTEPVVRKEDTNEVPSDIKVTQPTSTVDLTTKTTNTTTNPSHQSNEVDIHIINVGSADAILIEHNGEAVMVDAGKAMKNGNDSTTNIRNHINEFSKLKWLLTTHQDYDHIGNALFVLQSIDTEGFFDNGNAHTSQTYLNLMEYVAENSQIKYITPNLGDNLSPWSDVKITVAGINTSGGKDLNDDSIVLLVEYEGSKVALVGDISSEVEYEIAQKLGDCDVLKVAHHGSATSSSEEFLQVVKPEISVISVGENSYGHPTEEAITRLGKYGTVYRTDEFGCVNITLKDGKCEVNHCNV